MAGQAPFETGRHRNNLAQGEGVVEKSGSNASHPARPQDVVVRGVKAELNSKFDGKKLYAAAASSLRKAFRRAGSTAQTSPAFSFGLKKGRVSFSRGGSTAQCSRNRRSTP